MEKKKKIQKHKNHNYACALAEHAIVNYYSSYFPKFLLFCALSMEKEKLLDVLEERRRNVTARWPDHLRTPDLMTYVLWFLHTGNT